MPLLTELGCYQTGLWGRFGAMTTRLLNINEVSHLTGLSPHTLYTMVSQRRIPYVKVGRLLRFDPGHLEAWLKQHTVMPMPSKRA